jgi:hypothetical protein
MAKAASEMIGYLSAIRDSTGPGRIGFGAAYLMSDYAG